MYSTFVLADELPDLGEYSETILSTKAEKRLAREFIKEVRRMVPIVDDPIINDYIQTLGNQLASHAYTKRKNFYFFVVNDQNINAFAGPGGYIGINSGTIIAVDSASELAAIMAHEIAHVTQHHIERLIATAKNTQIAAVAGVLASIIIGATSNSQSLSSAANGAAITSMAGATQHMINFTREHEVEADNIGMKILYGSGFNPNAMVTAFERMQRFRYDYANDIPRLLLTHPVTSDRIAEAKNRTEQYHSKNIKEQSSFYLINARTKVLTDNNLLNTIKFFRTQLNTNKTQNREAIQYGYALALYKNHQLTEATKIATVLQNGNPQEVLFLMLGAQLALENKNIDKALGTLKTALISHPSYYPLVMQYGKTLIIAKHSQEACDFIRAKIKKIPNNSTLHRLLAEAYAENHQLADAYQAKARAYEIEGYYHQAAILLQQALKTPNLSSNNRAIINAKIDQLKEVLKEAVNNS